MPPRESHLLCDRYTKEIEVRISQDRDRGASQLYLDALKILKKWLDEEVLDQECFKKMLARLVKGQPSMAPMLNLANSLLLALEEGWDKVKEYVEKELEIFGKRVLVLAENACEHLSLYERLASVSFSSTVVEVFKAIAQKRRVTLVISKGDPVPYGLRVVDTLFGLVDTVVTTDALLPYLVRKVDAVVVGADSVDETGVVNGAGTFPLALAAKHFNKPFFVVCGTEKFLPSILSRYHVVKEEPFPIQLDRPHRVEYHIFDVTPVELVSAFITEKGVMTFQEFLEYQRGLEVSPLFHSIMEL